MKIKLISFIGLLLIGIFLMHSCGKDSPTIVNGTVVDKYTGKPIEGVSITLQITHKGDPSNNTEIKDIVSDENGNFYFEYNLPVYLFELRKSG